MTDQHPSRRTFLVGAGLAATTTPLMTTSLAAQRAADDTFPYEVQRTEEEWRAMLSEDEYSIMREGGTEPRFTSDLWNEERAGTYHCKGCDLKIYDSEWKVILPIGWVFWFHSEPNSVLTGIDIIPADMSEASEDMPAEDQVALEVHCRRCGSHLGHIFSIEEEVTHCINGSALNFTPSAA